MKFKSKAPLRPSAADLADAAKRALAATSGSFATKDVPFELVETKEAADTGSFSGYASIFGNVDLGGDVIERGAFKEMALTRDGSMRVLYQHDMRRPIGKARVSQDDKGLRVDGHLVLGISTARDAYEAMKAGILDGMSIGYDVLPGGADSGRGDDIRHITGLKLWEVSPVTFGMNPLARVDNVKTLRLQAIKSKRDFEDYLREEGFSANMAKSIATIGWKEAPAEHLRDAGEVVSGMTARLKAMDLTGADPRDAAANIKSLTEAIRQL